MEIDKVRMMISIKLEEINMNNKNITIDDFVSYLLDVKWRNVSKITLASVIADIFNSRTNHIVDYLTTKAYISPSCDILENINEIFGGNN